jgi:hypothetical protein
MIKNEDINVILIFQSSDIQFCYKK